MQIFKARSHDSTIESRLISSKWLDRSQVSEELTTIDQFQDQIQVLWVLGKTLEIDDEGVTDLRVNEVFIIDVIDLLCLDDLSLIQEFEGYVFSRLFVLGHFDLTEPSLTENSANLVVLEFQFSDCLALSFLHGIFLNIDYNQIENDFFFYNNSPL